MALAVIEFSTTCRITSYQWSTFSLLFALLPFAVRRVKNLKSAQRGVGGIYIRGHTQQLRRWLHKLKFGEPYSCFVLHQAALSTDEFRWARQRNQCDQLLECSSEIWESESVCETQIFVIDCSCEKFWKEFPELLILSLQETVFSPHILW